MKFEATMIKTKEAEPLGTYKPTELDARKAAADILVTYCGKYFEIKTREGLVLKRRGIKARVGHTNRYDVTDKALDVLRTQYKVECDF